MRQLYEDENHWIFCPGELDDQLWGSTVDQISPFLYDQIERALFIPLFSVGVTIGDELKEFEFEK